MPWPWPNRSKPPWKTCPAVFPKACDYDISLDTTLPITAGINEIIETLFIALALVILVVFIFIQDWRATLIPTIAIPVSLLATFIAFPLLGFTINVLSLLGLVLAIGIVVDDAIVVVEAVQVNIEKGMNAKEATIHAMKEVTAPGHRHHPGAGGGLHPGGRPWAASPAGSTSSLPSPLPSRWSFPRSTP
jgi:Cu/Ag efflux pump CusA